MGVLFSRFRSKPSTKELLEDLQKEIESLEDYKHSTELQQKALIGSLLFYAFLLYAIVAITVFLFYFNYTTTKDLVIYCIPFLIFPILVYIFKKFLQWYFLQKIRNNEENLSELRKKKKALLEFAMETETYKVVKELLEKYDPVNHRKIFEPKPAIEAPRPLLRGSFTEMDIRRRSMSPRGSPPTSFGFPSQTMGVNISPVRPPSMPRPVLPRERTLVDRLVDYLVGDGPSNRYALICRHCQSHNGMALKEEYEFISFRCCYCMQYNPARNQQPPPPQLTLPAPPPSAPIITEAPSEASNSSGDETEIENVGDSINSHGNVEESKEEDVSIDKGNICSEAEVLNSSVVEDNTNVSPETNEIHDKLPTTGQS